MCVIFTMAARAGAPAIIGVRWCSIRAVETRGLVFALRRGYLPLSRGLPI